MCVGKLAYGISHITYWNKSTQIPYPNCLVQPTQGKAAGYKRHRSGELWFNFYCLDFYNMQLNLSTVGCKVFKSMESMKKLHLLATLPHRPKFMWTMWRLQGNIYCTFQIEGGCAGLKKKRFPLWSRAHKTNCRGSASTVLHQTPS